MKSIILKVVSAIVVDGIVARAGQLIEVSEAEARNLLHRGKCELAAADDDAPAGGGDDDALVNLSKLNKAQLLEMAAELALEVSDKNTKAEIIAAIEAAQAE